MPTQSDNSWSSVYKAINATLKAYPATLDLAGKMGNLLTLTLNTISPDTITENLKRITEHIDRLKTEELKKYLDDISKSVKSTKYILDACKELCNLSQMAPTGDYITALP